MKILPLFLGLSLCPLTVLAQNSPQELSASQSYISLQGFGINPLGHFKDDWRQGTGGYVGYGFVYPNHWGVTFQVGYVAFRHDPDAELGDDPSFTLIPFMAGGRYYVLMNGVRPFFLGMSGFNLVSQRYVKDNEMVDETLVKLNFQIGVGIEAFVFSSLSLEVVGKYNSHVLDPNIPYNATGLEYGVALNWVLGH